MSGKTNFSGGQICQWEGGDFLIFFWWQSGDSHAISRQSNCWQLSHFAICRQSIYRLSTFIPPLTIPSRCVPITTSTTRGRTTPGWWARRRRAAVERGGEDCRAGRWAKCCLNHHDGDEENDDDDKHHQITTMETIKGRCQKKAENFDKRGGCHPNPTSFVIWSSNYFACQNHFEVLKHVLQ